MLRNAESGTGRTSGMVQPGPDPDNYPPIDPSEPVPDDPGELSPDTPETLPPAPVEPMPGPDDPNSVPAHRLKGGREPLRSDRTRRCDVRCGQVTDAAAIFSGRSLPRGDRRRDGDDTDSDLVGSGRDAVMASLPDSLGM
jgi:hypothetical protein